MVDSDWPWIGWAAVAVGVAAVVAAFAASSTQVGEGFAFGFGAFVAFFGVLAVLARNRRPDHWGLVVVGLAMFIVPFLGNGYAADPGASWTCWVAGGLAMILGGVGWAGGKTPSEYGINRIGSGQALRSTESSLDRPCSAPCRAGHRSAGHRDPQHHNRDSRHDRAGRADGRDRRLVTAGR